MSFTPARMITTSGFSAMTSFPNLERMVSERCPFTPLLRTFHSGWTFVIQWQYWLSGFPLPFGGASMGERNPGVPAVVESPSPTMVTCFFNPVGTGDAPDTYLL